MSGLPEVVQLRQQIAALEQLLEIQEQTVAEQSQGLERKTLELQRSNSALEQFAYVISHDLQEPLRMVAAYTELLRERYRGNLDEQADKYIDFASGGARRMQQLIIALLEYSRVTTHAKPLYKVEMDGVVKDVLLNLELAIRDARAEIIQEALPSVLGDRDQLAQLLQNLVANALKFRKDTGPVEIGIRGSIVDRKLRLGVSDNGIGIEPRHYGRIFDIFRRIHPKRFPGTGIGLAICRRIVERHEGELWVESTLGHGSTFYVTLQLASPRNP